jgi:uncharacterized SAM-binding protein YcdF (DUF218 family)
MLITLKMVLRSLLLPPAGPLLVAAAGACLIRSRSSGVARRTGWVLLIGALATLWLLATPIVADALTRLAQRCPALDLGRPVQAQAVVILGGDAVRPTAPEYGGAPAVAAGLLERVTYGAYVAQRTGLPVLVSGAAPEALAMRASLARQFHIDARWVEGRSRDTFQNAQFSAQILRAAGVRRVILVTEADHEWRAAREFASAGLGVVPAPAGVWTYPGSSPLRYVPGSAALAHSTTALYEILGDFVRRALAALDLRRHTS